MSLTASFMGNCVPLHKHSQLFLLLLALRGGTAASWGGDKFLSLLQLSTESRRENSEVRHVAEEEHSGVVLALIANSENNTGPSTNVLFEHIPKTAGTGIEDAAHRSQFKWGRFESGGYQQLMADGSRCSLHHVPASLLEDHMKREEYRKANVFCVVRDPYERIVSEYSYRLSVAGVPHHFRDHPQCTPDGLNYFVQQALLAYVSGKPFAFDCHLLPQHEYVYSDGERWCNNVLRMEDFPGNFNALMQKEGLEVAVDSKSFSFRNSCGGLSVKDLTPESIQMIDAVYAEDFRLRKSDLMEYTVQGAASDLDVVARAQAASPAVKGALGDDAAAAQRADAAVWALTIDPIGVRHLA